MSEVNASDARVIKNEEDVFDLYLGVGNDMKAGIEVELAFFNPANMKPMSVPQNRVLKNAALAAMPGEWVNNEPSADFLEVNSIAGSPQEIKDVLEDTRNKIQILTEKAQALGLKRSYFQDLPHVDAHELLKNIVDVDLYQAFFVPHRADMEGFARYFTVSKSNQVSVSYSDPDHMLDNMRRLYFLAPFLFMLTDNSSAFAEGKAFAGHQGMHYRSMLEQNRGGVPPYMYTAKTGEDYIRSHIEHVMNNPLFVYYNAEGDMVKLEEPGEWTTFLELEKQGLNIASNYYLAQSMLWPDVKLAALKDEDGEVSGHRYEARMFGVGIHQHQTAFLITSALAFHNDFGEKIDDLLSRSGFHMHDAESSYEALQSAYKAARTHDGKFFDIPYGLGTMAGFAKSFAELLEEAYNGKGFDDEITPILDICRSGCTDGKVNRLLFPTLESIQTHQKSFADCIFNNPCRTNRQVFEQQLDLAGFTNFSSKSVQS